MEKTELPIEDNLIVKLSFQFSVNTTKFIDSQHWGNKFSI